MSIESNVVPVLMQISLENARSLVSTGTCQSMFGLDTEPQPEASASQLAQKMLGARNKGLFYYRNEKSERQILMVIREDAGCRWRSWNVADPELLQVLSMKPH